MLAARRRISSSPYPSSFRSRASSWRSNSAATPSPAPRSRRRASKLEAFCRQCVSSSDAGLCQLPSKTDRAKSKRVTPEVVGDLKAVRPLRKPFGIDLKRSRVSSSLVALSAECSQCVVNGYDERRDNRDAEADECGEEDAQRPPKARESKKEPPDSEDRGTRDHELNRSSVGEFVGLPLPSLPRCLIQRRNSFGWKGEGANRLTESRESFGRARPRRGLEG